MHSGNGTIEVRDIRLQGEDSTDLREELVASLTRPSSFRSIPSILLWDDRGQELFEKIMDCPQYYPFRAELALLSGYSDQMVIATGQSRLIIELGAGYVFHFLFPSAFSHASHPWGSNFYARVLGRGKKKLTNFI